VAALATPTTITKTPHQLLCQEHTIILAAMPLVLDTNPTQHVDEVRVGLEVELCVGLRYSDGLAEEHERFNDVYTTDHEEPHVGDFKLGNVIRPAHCFRKSSVEEEHDDDGDKTQDGEFGIDFIDDGSRDGVSLVLVLELVEHHFKDDGQGDDDRKRDREWDHIHGLDEDGRGPSRRRDGRGGQTRTCQECGKEHGMGRHLEPEKGADAEAGYGSGNTPAAAHKVHRAQSAEVY
jgi:hypothetical protein